MMRVLLVALAASMIGTVGAVWVREITDDGSNSTITRACCVQRDITGSTDRVLVLGETNGQVDPNTPGTGTFDFFLVQYVAATGVRSSVVQFDDDTGDEESEFLVVNENVPNGNVVMFGTTTGTLVGTNAGGRDLCMIILSNSFLPLETLQYGTVGDDTMDGVEVTNASYIVVGTGKSSAGAAFNDQLLLWIVGFNFAEVFRGSVDSVSGSENFLSVLSTAWAVEEDRLVIGVEKSTVPGTFRSEIQGYTQTAGFQWRTTTPISIGGETGFFGTNDMEYSNTGNFSGVYFAGQFPQAKNELITEFDAYCSGGGSTLAMYSWVDPATGTIESGYIQLEENFRCGDIGIVVRVGVSQVNPDEPRVLFGYDLWSFLNGRFEMTYVTKVAPDGVGQSGVVLSQLVSDQQNFVGLNPIGTSAIMFGTYTQRENSDPCDPQGPDRRNVTLASVSASTTTTLPEYFLEIGSLCDETVSDVLTVDTNINVVLGTTTGSLVGDGNPEQRPRVYVFTFDPVTAELPTFSPSCATGCVDLTTPSPEPTATVNPNCIENGTHCSCLVASFSDCVSPNVETTDSCSVGTCLGIRCDCDGESLCRLDRRTDWVATEPVGDRDVVPCELLTTEFPSALWTNP